MPRSSVRSAVANSPAPDPKSGLSQDQTEILRLFYVEGKKLSTIAAFLRQSVRTVERLKADALALLKSSDADMRGQVLHQQGGVRFTIAIDLGGEVKDRLDSTASTVAAFETVPGLRSAFYAPDLRPQEAIEKRAKAERKRSENCSNK